MLYVRLCCHLVTKDPSVLRSKLMPLRNLQRIHPLATKQKYLKSREKSHLPYLREYRNNNAMDDDEENQYPKLKSHDLIEFLTLESSASQENYARLQNDVSTTRDTLCVQLSNIKGCCVSSVKETLC